MRTTYRFHMKGTIARGAMALMLAAAPAFALPQQGTTTQAGAGAAPRARSRCMGCSDSARALYDVLITRLDSLRWDIWNRRLTPAQETTMTREMSEVIRSLQQLMESNSTPRPARIVATPTPQGGVAVAGSRMAPVPAEGFTIVVQTGKKGWIGATFEGPSYGYPPPPQTAEVIRFIQYPRIASLDPASPAERAGLLVGDTLLAMNGTDVVESSIQLSKILVPDEKVTLRIRRAGDAKEFRVNVGTAPSYVVQRITPRALAEVEVVSAAAPGEAARAEVAARGGTVVGAARAGGMGGAQGGRAPDAPAPAIRRQSFDEPASRPMFFGSFATIAFAGARMESINEGVGRALGVKGGVLVIQVAPGTPAFVSGLRDGDVILSAAGNEIASTRELNRFVIAAEQDGVVKLVVLREKKQQDLTLRWK
jgi:membrane-associated protease RseP (regulator of RpoE activity)